MNIDKKFPVAIGAIVAAFACNAQPAAGLIRIRSDGSALLFTTHQPIKGEQIQVQYPDNNDKVTCCALARLTSPRQIETEEYVSDELSGMDIKAYRVLLDVPFLVAKPFIGVAAIGTSLSIKSLGSEIIVQSGGAKSSIRTCLSSEGVHLFGFDGSKKVSHLYMSLGYDVRPNCPSSFFSGK